MVIAVDVTGGDYFPENPVKGALLALEENSELTVLLVGPSALIEKELQRHAYDASRVRTLDAPEIITMDDAASAALKTKTQSSITVGITAHKNGACDGFVSAGNTGALLAASTFILGKLPGVSRPTIAAAFPTIKGVRLLIDAGANLELKPEMYLQFSRMATVFLKRIMHVDDPKVGLVNVGSEAEKGTDTHRQAYELLSRLDNFVGNIEGKDILYGKADVILTDGFTGNVLLKFGESIPDVLKMMIGKALKEANADAAAQKMMIDILTSSLQSFNYEHVGGVPFLGVNGISFVGHGGSSPTAIKNMILRAAECIKHGLNDKIVSALQ
ncbi:MAG: phosphate acyltransferase PlsX [Balneolaceae bacterium]